MIISTTTALSEEAFVMNTQSSSCLFSLSSGNTIQSANTRQWVKDSSFFIGFIAFRSKSSCRKMVAILIVWIEGAWNIREKKKPGGSFSVLSLESSHCTQHPVLKNTWNLNYSSFRVHHIEHYGRKCEPTQLLSRPKHPWQSPDCD